jgi:hypothetical protein
LRDSSNGDDYTKWQERLPDEMLIFHEGAA